MIFLVLFVYTQLVVSRISIEQYIVKAYSTVFRKSPEFPVCICKSLILFQNYITLVLHLAAENWAHIITSYNLIYPRLQLISGLALKNV